MCSSFPFFYIYFYVYWHVCMYLCMWHGPTEVDEGIRCPGVGVTCMLGCKRRSSGRTARVLNPRAVSPAPFLTRCHLFVFFLWFWSKICLSFSLVFGVPVLFENFFLQLKDRPLSSSLSFSFYCVIFLSVYLNKMECIQMTLNVWVWGE